MAPSVLGADLLDLCGRARGFLVLCAPFVKRGVIERVLAHTQEGVSVELFTRWRPEEVAAGVSDTGVLELLESRNGSVHLCDRLHAKFYRADDVALVGSANLTATALGWTVLPNLEVLLELPSAAVAQTEQELRREACLATAAIAAEVERVAALLPRMPFETPEQVTLELVGAGYGPWLPALREPADLFVAYSVGSHRLSSASAVGAQHDLAALDLPPGLERPAFEALVAQRLGGMEVVRHLDRLLEEPMRFGAVRDALGRFAALERAEADRAWQTLMRWLLEFMPGRYERRVNSRSEIFMRQRERDS